MMALLVWLWLASVAEAASLAWDYDLTKGVVPATATVQRSASLTGPYATVVTIPSLPSTWLLPTIEDNQFYRISNEGGVSNVVQYVVLTAPPGPVAVDTLTPRVTLLEQKVTALEAQSLRMVTVPPVAPYLPIVCYDDLIPGSAPMCIPQVPITVTPPVTTNFLTTRQIDSTHVELTCAGTSMKTTGSGLRRVVECLP